MYTFSPPFLKLAIAYGFVLHRAIDRYSRRVIYLKCNTNNRAQTGFISFPLKVLMQFPIEYEQPKAEKIVMLRFRY
jgi:hypothetical protein